MKYEKHDISSLKKSQVPEILKGDTKENLQTLKSKMSSQILDKIQLKICTIHHRYKSKKKKKKRLPIG